MIINDNYIIKHWNLSQIKNIDFENCNFYFENKTPALNLKLTRNIFHCKNCFSEYISIRGSKIQTIKHALSDLSFAIIKFHKRSFKCSSCNHVFSETLDYFVYSRETSIFLEYAVLEHLKDLTFTYKKIAEKYHVSSSFVMAIFDKHINIKPKPLPKVLSIDEIYARKLTPTKYCCILMDPLNKSIIDVLYSRRKELLLPYFSRRSREEKNEVLYFICDLNDTYRQLAYKCFFNVTVAADSFHVIRNLTDAYDAVRIIVMKEHEDFQDYSMEYWLLKKFHWMLETDLSEIKKDYYEFRKWNMTLSKYQLVDYMLKVDERLTEAYLLKESYREFNKYHKIKPGDDTSNIQDKLNALISAFKNSMSPSLISFGNTLFNWQKEIVNSFIYLGNFRLSNSMIERYNGLIKQMMAGSFGFTNFDRTRLRIIFAINENEAFSMTPQYKSNKRNKKPRGPYKK